MGLEQIKANLVDSMGDDLSVVNSARVSFYKESKKLGAWVYMDSEERQQLLDEGYREVDLDIDAGMEYLAKLSDKDRKLVKYLADHKHMTPFRHNQIQIRCHAPIFLARQLGKHQAGLSWNEVSRRYVDTPPEFFIPDEWRGRPDGSIKQGSVGVVKANQVWQASYEYLIDQCLTEYTAMVEQGVSPEMVRMILPQSMMTTWWWTGNLLSFAHVYKERISEGAQLEAQHFAKELDAVIRPLFPVAWEALVGGVK